MSGDPHDNPSDKSPEQAVDPLHDLLAGAVWPEVRAEQLARLQRRWTRIFVTGRDIAQPKSSANAISPASMELPSKRSRPHRPAWVAIGLAASVLIAITAVTWSAARLRLPSAVQPGEAIRSTPLPVPSTNPAAD